MSRVALLLRQMDEVYDRLRRRLEGLTDDEYFWEPAPGCWTVHRDPTGAWVIDYAEPDPDPAPLTTIGWRLVHLAHCKGMYHHWGFGARRLHFPPPPRAPPGPGGRGRRGGGRRPWRALATTSSTGRAGPAGASGGRPGGSC